jgi:lysozyme
MISGFDVSHGNNIPNNFAGLSPEVKFMIIKATQGAGFKDPKFQQYWQFCKDHDLIHGAYHFLTVNASAQSQVSNYMSRGIDWSLPGVLPPILDVEDQVSPTGDPAETATLNKQILDNKQAWTDKVEIWLETIKIKTGRTPIIYSYKNFFKEYMLNTTKFSGCPLWISAFQDTAPGLPTGWSDFTFWQFSERGNVVGPKTGGDIDWNYFNGTIDQLNALAHIK